MSWLKSRFMPRILCVGLLPLALASSAPPIVWTIAGSDAGGGAGIQADLHAFQSLGTHGCTVVTALTAQNSREVRKVEFTSAEMLRATIGALEDDLPAVALKLGMLGSRAVIREVAAFLARYEGIAVCDPVMVTTSGARLLDEECTADLINDVFPYCALVTPNLQEAEALVGRRLHTAADVEAAAKEILRMGPGAVLIKGGHSEAEGAAGAVSQDYYRDVTRGCWLSAARIDSEETHGTGCTLSSAICALLSHGLPLLDAVVLAKAYVTQGIARAVRLGYGPGPVAHAGYPEVPNAMPWLTAASNEGIDRPCFARCSAGALRGLLPVLGRSDEIERAVRGGVRDVQIRLKDYSSDEVRQVVKQAQAACESAGARLWVNDHWRVAIECGAYGVHMGQEDLGKCTPGDLRELAAAGLRLGLSTHSYSELATALAVQPSYISLGPIYETRSKAVPFEPQGLERLSRWRKLVPSNMPLCAIGGIQLHAAPSVLEAGADAIAVISALTRDWERLPEWRRLFHAAQ